MKTVFSERDIRTWPVVNGWSVDPGTGARIWINARAEIGEGATIGEGAEIGARAEIGAGATIGEGAVIGAWAEIGEEATIGAWATIGVGARIGARARIGAWAEIGAGARIGAWARIGARARIGEGETTTGLNLASIAAMRAVGPTAYFVKWVTSDGLSPAWGNASPIPYNDGDVVEAPTAEPSDQQCDVGLHVFRVGILPWHCGFGSPDDGLIPKLVEVAVDDICYAGWGGATDKIRVRRLKVLRTLDIPGVTPGVPA